ncbi:hypothetical protein [Enterococcus mundtii]|uniref:hypothetical protein n=1 Tax=Enterococcus mundtii TaxID=53346 RepID=UPI001A97BC46|nr:hypothetical protein [Enterococcus mundtii]MBO1087240.1 hypothetical protein [Enterococcus mundtii]
MAIDFQKLANPVADRKIREVIMAGGENIRVYEPNIEDVRTMVEFQEQKLQESDDIGDVSISGNELIRKFFPLLTDITGLEDLTDEEIEKVVDEPSVAFLQVEQVVKSIITEIYKVMILSARTQVLETDFEAEGRRAENQILDAAFSQAAKEMGAEELLNRVNRQDEELKAAIESSIDRRGLVQDGIKHELAESGIDKTVILQTEKVSKDQVKVELEEENPHLKAQSLYAQYKKDFE